MDIYELNQYNMHCQLVFNDHMHVGLTILET